MMELLEFTGLLTMAANKNLHPLQSSTTSLTTSSIHNKSSKNCTYGFVLGPFQFSVYKPKHTFDLKSSNFGCGGGGEGGWAGHATACSRCDAVTHARLYTMHTVVHWLCLVAVRHRCTSSTSIYHRVALEQQYVLPHSHTIIPEQARYQIARYTCDTSSTVTLTNSTHRLSGCCKHTFTDLLQHCCNRSVHVRSVHVQVCKCMFAASW